VNSIGRFDNTKILHFVNPLIQMIQINPLEH
jgi:hypothetical protein